MTSPAVSRQIVPFEPNQDTFKYSEVLFISPFIRGGREGRQVNWQPTLEP